jgi:hypothetical protein
MGTKWGLSTPPLLGASVRGAPHTRLQAAATMHARENGLARLALQGYLAGHSGLRGCGVGTKGRATAPPPLLALDNE